MKNILDTVVKEIESATEKFPTWPTDPLHAVAVLGEEYGELQKAVLQFVYEPKKSSREHIEEEAIQTAAMAIRFLLSLNEYSYLGSQQHEQPVPDDSAPASRRIDDLEHLFHCAVRLRATPPVDDDFPEVMHHFDCAIKKLTEQGAKGGE